MLSRSILISLLLLLMPVFLRAQTFTVGNHTYTVLSEEEKTVSLTSSTQTTGELIIPTEVTDDNGISYTVTKIGDRAFCDGSGVKYSGLTGTLVIPNSIKEIGDYAFAKCTGFTGLKFNDNLESIGNYAFAGESTSGDSKRLIMNFTGPLSFPRTLKKIGKRAFYNCYHLTGSITIPEDMELGEGIFVSCQGLNGTLTFEGVRETIPASFAYDAGFTEVNLPKGLKTIGGCAFVKNKFESIVLPETLETIEGQGFYLCEQLKSIKLPSSLTSLGLWAFAIVFRRV